MKSGRGQNLLLCRNKNGSPSAKVSKEGIKWKLEMGGGRTTTRNSLSAFYCKLVLFILSSLNL
jgi:hypothetical protein